RPRWLAPVLASVGASEPSRSPEESKPRCRACRRFTRGPGLDTSHPLRRGGHGRGFHSGFEDADERPAAADVAAQALPRLLDRWIGNALEKRSGGHDEARRAE